METLRRIPERTVEFNPLAFRVAGWPARAFAHMVKVAFTFSGLCYGCLHLTAWDAVFPSNTQKLLWRISCLGLAASGFLLAALEYLFGLLYEHASQAHVLPRLCKALLLFSVVVTALFYAFCRVYLVVDCFIVMGHLPESVYRVPVWSQYFPHIG
jgi:hypothetical protein